MSKFNLWVQWDRERGSSMPWQKRGYFISAWEQGQKEELSAIKDKDDTHKSTTQ